MVKNKKTIQFIGVDCILMVILTLLDQWTKSLVVHHLKDQSDIILIPGIFRLHYLENRGAAFGILQNQRIIFVILTIIYLAAVFWFLHRCPKTGRYTLFAYYSISSDSGSPRELCMIWLLAWDMWWIFSIFH
ncbi:MAG: signal peptidase II [Lachnospiraceae bacterium]